MTKLKNSGKWNKELREETETMHRYEYGNKDASHLLIQLIDEHNRPMMEKEIDEIQNEAGDDFHLIAFEVNDWNDDLSPWKAPAVFGDHHHRQLSPKNTN